MTAKTEHLKPFACGRCDECDGGRGAQFCLTPRGGCRCAECVPAKTDEALLEQLAAIEHERWSGWMRYLFTQGEDGRDGRFNINAASVARWRRQTETDYTNLSEPEKESDRKEARKSLAVMESALASERARADAAGREVEALRERLSDDEVRDGFAAHYNIQDVDEIIASIRAAREKTK